MYLTIVKYDFFDSLRFIILGKTFISLLRIHGASSLVSTNYSSSIALS